MLVLDHAPAVDLLLVRPPWPIPLIPLDLEGVPHQLHVLEIVPQRSGSVHSAWPTGRVNVNVDPSPDWLLTQICPPCSSMNFLDKASPPPARRRRRDSPAQG